MLPPTLLRPLLDRIDIHVEVPFKDLTSSHPAESFAAIHYRTLDRNLWM